MKVAGCRSSITYTAYYVRQRL